MAISTAQAEGLAGRDGHVYDAAGLRIGAIGQIYLDEDTDTPAWVSILTGLHGDAESLAPLQGARLHGDDILIRYRRTQVEQAPRAAPDHDVLTDVEGRQLRLYYDLRTST